MNTLHIRIRGKQVKNKSNTLTNILLVLLMIISISFCGYTIYNNIVVKKEYKKYQNKINSLEQKVQ